MTWIEVARENLDGSSIIYGHNNEGGKSTNSSRRTTVAINQRPNRSIYWKKKRKSGSSGESSSGIGSDGSSSSNNDIGIPPTFSNEQSKEFCIINNPNLSSSEVVCGGATSRCSCTDCIADTNRENNVPTLNEMGNDDASSSVFRTAPASSPCSSSYVLNRNSKHCNQLVQPLSSSSPPPTSSSWLLFLLVFSWNLSSTSSFCPPYCNCDDVALSVDCHSANSNLRVVPIFLNPQIKFLSLSKSQIKDITMSLQFYSELQVLDISHNKLESLGKSNFESLRGLHLLNVSYSAISKLENGVFTGLTNMRVLDISANQLEHVQPEVFWSLSNIKEIILDRNRLEFLDWDLFRGLDTLERISAKFNFIQVIEPSPTISLSSISSSTRSIAFSNNSNLNGSTTTSFVGSGGVISSWSLKNVRYLDLSSNQLTRVKDYGLVIFGALKEISLSNNYIHTLEEKAFLISASSSSGSTAHLERVDLSGNRLGRVPTHSLEKLGSTLRQLDLSSNRISDHISKNAFRGLVHLESLRLSDNPEILYIDPDALSENINLINFEADYLSNLTELSPTLLKNKMFLENFSVKYASISTLSPDFFQPPVADIVGCLALHGNPIDCNCSAHSFYQFVTMSMGASVPASVYSASSPYDFDQSVLGGGTFRDENNNLIHENAFRSMPNDDRVNGKSNSSSQPNSELSSHSNPNLISHQSTSFPSRSRSSSSPKRNNNSNLSNSRTNLLYVRCQSPSNLAGVLVKDLKPSDFQHCFTDDDQFQIMVICIAAGILSLIFLTLAIKLCCVCGVFGRMSAFCKTHCSTTNCCQLKSRKEKQSSDKLFFDSMTIALRRDMAPVAPPPNFNANIPNGKSILGEHPTSQLLYCGNGTTIPLTTAGGAIGGGSNAGGIGTATLGRNGNGNHQITMSMDYDDCYQDEDEDDDDDEEEHQHQQRHQRPPQHRTQLYGHREPLERCYAPIEPPPPIPIPLQFPNQVQSLSRKQQQKHQQLLLHHGHQHHSPTMGYSPKHYPHHHQHSSPKHSQQQQHNPPVIVHYEYPDFPSMHRVKQVPSVLV